MNHVNVDSDPVPAQAPPPQEEESTLEKIKRLDAQREGIPGEHWIVLGAGLAIWAVSSKSPSLLWRTLGLMAGSALVGRAATGRDGAVKLLRYLPVGSKIRHS